MSLRADALLLTRGRPGTEPLIGAALLLDAIRSGDLDVIEGRRVVAGLEATGGLLAELRERVLAGPPGPPGAWIERTAAFAPHRVAVELVSSGLAAPLGRRFRRGFTLSVDARAEAAARRRVSEDPALACLLFVCGLPTGDPLPPAIHSLPAPERAVLMALRQAVLSASVAARIAG
jgi:hypothetical protein